MTDFNFTLLVNDPPATILTAALGTGAANQFASIDVGKGVKLGPQQNYIELTAGDDIEGVVDSISAEGTVNSGFSAGGVQVDRRILATVGANQAGSLAIGDLVVSDTPVAVGSAGIVQVKVGAPAIFNWRVIRLVTGTGVTGNTVLLEKV